MIIRGVNYPSIGLIRAKPIADTGRYTLTIFPPSEAIGGLPGHEPAMAVEVEVDQAELDRIERSAPHLLAQRRRFHEWGAARAQPEGGR